MSKEKKKTEDADGNSIGGAGLKKAFENIRKAFGKDAIQAGDYIIKDIDVIPTGAISLDLALGVGGVPRGRLTEIFGMESSGKTTLASHVVANAQAAGLVAAFVDLEHAYDMAYAKRIGVDPDKLLFCQPSSGEEAFAIINELTESGEVALIVVDSVANMVTQNEIDNGKAEMGGMARLMSSNLRALVSKASKTNTAILFINQIRMKIGIVFGSPETTPGGNALRFHASVRIRIGKKGIMSGKSTTTDDEKEAVGNKVLCKVIKNKVASPFKTAEFDIYFGKGIDHAGCLIELAVKYGIVEKSSTYYVVGDKKYNGIKNASAALQDNPELFNEIYKRTLEKARPNVTVIESVETADEEETEETDGD